MINSKEILTQQCGTPAYIAPEILIGKGYEGFAADIWSAGVVLFAITYGTVPFKSSTMPDLHKLIMKGKYTLKPSVSEELRDLIKHMLEINPKKRYTIPQILRHKWFLNYDKNISLFTEYERQKIETDYSKPNNDDRNKLAGNLSSTIDSDWFIEQNIDKSESDLTKNITSKSRIFAPFNTTKSHQSEIHESIEELILDKKAVRLSSRIKDADKQYEKNNNCEVDNGIYNEFINNCSNSNLNPLEGNDDSINEGKDDIECIQYKHPNK